MVSLVGRLRGNLRTPTVRDMKQIREWTDAELRGVSTCTGLPADAFAAEVLRLRAELQSMTEHRDEHAALLYEAKTRAEAAEIALSGKLAAGHVSAPLFEALHAVLDLCDDPSDFYASDVRAVIAQHLGERTPRRP